MQHTNNKTNTQISLFAKQVALPSNEDTQKELLHAVEQAVETVLAEHGLEPDWMKTIGGHAYSSVSADCPACSDRLRVIEPMADASNGVVASASCECGWRGDAVYRLIDLREPRPDEGVAENVEQDTLGIDWDTMSNVRQATIRPRYYPY